MTQDNRGGIVGTYSSGVKMTLKVLFTPMETTVTSNYLKLSEYKNVKKYNQFVSFSFFQITFNQMNFFQLCKKQQHAVNQLIIIKQLIYKPQTYLTEDYFLQLGLMSNWLSCRSNRAQISKFVDLNSNSALKSNKSHN